MYSKLSFVGGFIVGFLGFFACVIASFEECLQSRTISDKRKRICKTFKYRNLMAAKR